MTPSTYESPGAFAKDVATVPIDGRLTVPSAGTAVRFFSQAVPCKWVAVTAFTANTQAVAVGGPSVAAASGSERGMVLQPGAQVSIPVVDASLLYADARVSGEGLSYTMGA